MPTGIRDLRPNHDAIEVVINGDLPAESGPLAMLEAVEFQRAAGVPRLLADLTPRVQYSTVPQVVMLAEAMTKVVPVGWKQAFLPPRSLGAAMSVDTWEAACANRGLNVRVFRDRDRDAALAWLTA